MFRFFGAERVAILDGGIQKWKRRGATHRESGRRLRASARFDAL